MSDQANAPTLKPSPAVAEVLVWDVPVRVFHWLLVFCVAVAWLSAESERWRWWRFASFGAGWVRAMRGLPTLCAHPPWCGPMC